MGSGKEKALERWWFSSEALQMNEQCTSEDGDMGKEHQGSVPGTCLASLARRWTAGSMQPKRPRGDRSGILPRREKLINHTCNS
jgi:hypothetical protein